MTRGHSSATTVIAKHQCLQTLVLCGKYASLQNRGFMSNDSYVLEFTNKSELPFKMNILNAGHE